MLLTKNPGAPVGMGATGALDVFEAGSSNTSEYTLPTEKSQAIDPVPDKYIRLGRVYWSCAECVRPSRYGLAIEDRDAVVADLAEFLRLCFPERERALLADAALDSLADRPEVAA